MIKPGIKSTEFWLSVISMILAILKQHIIPDLPSEAFYTVIAYILGRSLVKLKNS